MPCGCLLKHQTRDGTPGDDWIEQGEKSEVTQIINRGGDGFIIQMKGNGCAAKVGGDASQAKPGEES